MSVSDSITTADGYGRIRRRVKLAGSQRAFAVEVGLTPAFVSQVVNGVKPIPDSVLRAVGVRRVVSYQEANH